MNQQKLTLVPLKKLFLFFLVTSLPIIIIVVYESYNTTELMFLRVAILKKLTIQVNLGFAITNAFLR